MMNQVWWLSNHLSKSIISFGSIFLSFLWLYCFISTSNLHNAQSEMGKMNHPIRGCCYGTPLVNVNISNGHRNNEMSTLLYVGICGSSSWWYILWLSVVIGCHYTSDGNWLPNDQSEASPPLHTSVCLQLQIKSRKATRCWSSSFNELILNF